MSTDFVLFYVSDMQKAIEFYRGFLGLSLEFYKEKWQWAEFNAGNVTLTLSGGRPANAGGGVIALAVTDLEAAAQEVAAKGIKVKRPLHELSTCWHLEILDPDGNTVILHKRKDGTYGN